jgi:hypothetical protein
LRRGVFNTPHHATTPRLGLVIAIQSFRDFPGFSYRCHILCTDGCFYRNGVFPVIYAFKDGKSKVISNALERLAAMCSHVPNKGEQIVRYYGYHSDASQEKRHEAEEDALILCSNRVPSTRLQRLLLQYGCISVFSAFARLRSTCPPLAEK